VLAFEVGCHVRKGHGLDKVRYMSGGEKKMTENTALRNTTWRVV